MDWNCVRKKIIDNDSSITTLYSHSLQLFKLLKFFAPNNNNYSDRKLSYMAFRAPSTLSYSDRSIYDERNKVEKALYEILKSCVENKM